MLGEGSSALRRLQFAGVVVDQFESRAAVPAVTVEDSGHCWELASRSAPATPSVTCDEKAGGTTAGPHGRKLLPLQAAVSAHARPHSAESAVCAAPRPSWPMASPPPLEEEEEQAASSSSPSSARCPVSTPSPRARCHSPSVEDAAAAGHTLASLPADVLTEVGGFLPVEEYGAFAGVCTHTAREVAPALWRTVRGVAVSHSLLHGRELSRLLQRCPSLHALDLRSADFVHGSSFRAFLREPGTARLRRLHLPPSTPRAALEDGLPTLLAGVSTLGLRRVDAFSDAVVQAERLPVSTSLRALDARQCWRLTDQGASPCLTRGRGNRAVAPTPHSSRWPTHFCCCPARRRRHAAVALAADGAPAAVPLWRHHRPVPPPHRPALHRPAHPGRKRGGRARVR